MAETRIFWREFRQTFNTTGAVLPSGASLAKSLARYVGTSNPFAENKLNHERVSSISQKETPRRIIEIGPGTGPVTSQILQQMGPNDTLDLVELNSRFASLLEDRLLRDPNWRSVADRVRIHCLPIEELTAERPYEVLISGLPLNNFSCELVESILTQFHALAAPGATLSFFEYVAIRKAKSLFCKIPQRHRLSGIERILSRQFKQWEFNRECVVANVPPAWVHHLRLPGQRLAVC